MSSSRSTIDRRELVAQLTDLGVERGGVLVVHTAFSNVGRVEGGPTGLIAALLETLGPQGTLVMPSMTGDDEAPFDPSSTDCIGMGVVADTFWRMPGVLRSDSPHAFAAIGPHAGTITAPHPVDVPHGLDSPAGRAFELDGQVLLLGVGHDANTTIHVAENLASVRYRLPAHATIMIDGKAVRCDYDEVDHCCANFSLMDEWLVQRRGRIGHGDARLMRSRDVVETAVARLRANDTVFLHAPGACEECDRALAAV